MPPLRSQASWPKCYWALTPPRAPACSGLEGLCSGMWEMVRVRTVCGCGHATVIM